MTKAHKDFQGLNRMQMRAIFHSLNNGEKTVRQIAIKYGITEKTTMAVWREMRRSIRAFRKSRAVAA